MTKKQKLRPSTKSIEKENLVKLGAFFTLKHHEENFNANPKCRLIKPSKSDIDKLTNGFERAKETIRLSVKKWNGTDTVTNWFKIRVNVENFYFRAKY